MSNELEKYSNADLIAEILQRNELQESPSKIEFAAHHYILDVGIGPDNTAGVIVDDDTLNVGRGHSIETPWISVEEQLPEEENCFPHNVLVLVESPLGEQVCVATHFAKIEDAEVGHPSHWYIDYPQDTPFPAQITHWMPMPKTREEKKDEVS